METCRPLRPSGARAWFVDCMENPRGLLSKHLKDLSFVPATALSKGTAGTRGGAVVRKRKGGKSGCTGHQSRSNQLKTGKLELGTAYLEQLRRGRDPAERRKAEQAKRKPRPNACRGKLKKRPSAH